MCQPLSIKGNVINEASEPVAGATITLKRTGLSILSATNGEFGFERVQYGDTVIVSAVGYQSAVEGVRERGLITILLKRKVGLLQEVVVNTGYQTGTKERATGSFETVGPRTLNLQAGSSIISRLEGVSSIFFDNNPLRPPLTIRGPSSILASKDPLIVLDNFPYNGDINNINPADIESVTLLKDAAAASIWGARAGNGVIVITTKRGGISQPLKIEVTTGMEITARPDLRSLPLISSADMVEVESFLFSKGFSFSDSLSTARPAFSPVYEILFKKRSGRITATEAEEQLAALRQGDIRADLEKYNYRPAVRRQQALNLRGGSGTVSYYFSAGFDDQVTNLSGQYKRISLRSENNFRLSKAFRLSTAISYTGTQSRSGRPSFETLKPGTYPYTRLADRAGNPVAVTRNLRQSYIDTAGGGRLLDWNYYPLDDYQHNRRTENTTHFLAAFGLQYHLSTTLSLDVKYQYQKQEGVQATLQDEDSYYTRDLVNRFTQINGSTGAVKYNVPPGSILDKGVDRLVSNSLRSQLNFTKVKGRGALTAIAGAELREVHTTGSSYRLYGYNQDVLTIAAVDYVNPYPLYTSGAPAYIPANAGESDALDRSLSLYANAAYTYKGRYTASASARRDASNLFGVSTNNKWRPLWSAGGAWLLSAEPFYKSAFLPLLRLRLTYGYSGNIDQSRSAVTTISYGVNAAGTNFPTATINQFPDPLLRSEKIGTLNMAADFATKGSRLYGSLEYYIKKGTDLFGSSPVDYTAVGAKTLTINIADMRGSGVDLMVNSLNTVSKLKWSTTVLFNYTTSRVTKYFLTSTRGFDHISGGTKITAIIGRPVYSLLSFAWGGLDSLGNPVGLVNKVPTTTYSTIIGTATQLSDLVYSGPATPPFFGNLSNSFSFKGFTLTANILYKLGFYFRKESLSYDVLFNQHVGSADYANRWKVPGDEKVTTIPSMIYPNNASRDAFYTASEVLVRKGDNIRLQFVNLSYEWQRNKGKTLDYLRFYVVASNLGIIWRANKEGLDPDYGSALAPAKTIAFGIAATLK